MWKLVLLLLPCVLVSAQALSSLSGTVTDPSGSAIAKATLQAAQIATGARRSVMTGPEGNYSFPQLTPGVYDLSVSAPGMRTVIIHELTIQVQSPATRNFQLELSAAADSVTVSAESASFQTQDATLGNNFSTKPILQLPFEGRNIIGLLALQPGVTYYGENNPSSYRSGNVNGGKSDQANITLDGVDANEQDERALFTTAFRISLDAVQEFRVISTGANDYSAAGDAVHAALRVLAKHAKIRGFA